jgi:ligand-binding sensor domain-containing protein
MSRFLLLINPKSNRILFPILMVLWLITAFLAIPSVAQPASYTVGQASVREWGVRDGLSQSSVNTILQDHQGFMWFGTQDGLNKFDGHTFKVYEHIPGDFTTVSDNHIRHIYQDQEGIIWLGTRNGLSRLDPLTDKIFVYISTSKPTSLNALVVTTMVQDKQGKFVDGNRAGRTAPARYPLGPLFALRIQPRESSRYLLRYQLPERHPYAA